MKFPPFITDLYRDLRDRHLLLPAVALLAGIVAVPFLLSSGEAAVPPPAPAASAEPAGTIPAVLVDDEVSVRDYRERLDDLKSKNPFTQQFLATADAPADGTGGDAPLDGGLPVLPTDDAGGISNGAITPEPITPPPTTGTTDDTSGDDTSGNTDHGDVEVVNQLFVRRVDLMVGVQGDLKRRNGVQPMTILPNQSTPVAAFLGADEAGKRAAFVVSSDVTDVGGDAACVPESSCMFIVLEKGESATFDYGPDGQTYEIDLLAIRNVKLKTD